ncbi:MAG: hypothetical protein ACPG52_10410 [Cognaticolwellia sp.]
MMKFLPTTMLIIGGDLIYANYIQEKYCTNSLQTPVIRTFLVQAIAVLT